MHALALLVLLPVVLAVPTPVAPVIEPRGVQIVPGKYIVKLKDGVSDTKLNGAISKLGSINADHVYRAGSFKGFASKMDATTLAKIQSLPEVRLPYSTRS
jgi:hypothetical protein